MFRLNETAVLELSSDAQYIDLTMFARRFGISIGEWSKCDDVQVTLNYLQKVDTIPIYISRGHRYLKTELLDHEKLKTPEVPNDLARILADFRISQAKKFMGKSWTMVDHDDDQLTVEAKLEESKMIFEDVKRALHSMIRAKLELTEDDRLTPDFIKSLVREYGLESSLAMLEAPELKLHVNHLAQAVSYELAIVSNNYRQNLAMMMLRDSYKFWRRIY